MAGPYSSGKSEADLAEDIKNLLGLPEALTSFVLGAEAGRPEVELELISDPVALLRVSREPLSTFLNASGRGSLRAWVSSLELVRDVLGRYGVLADVPSLGSSVRSAVTHAPVVQEDSSEKGAAAAETGRTAELFSWADHVIGVGDAELELELDQAAKRFELARQTLSRIVKARRNERK